MHNYSPIKDLAVIVRHIDQNENVADKIIYLNHLSNLRKNVVDVSDKLSKEVISNLSSVNVNLNKTKNAMKQKYYYLTIYESILETIDKVMNHNEFDKQFLNKNTINLTPLPKCTADDLLYLNKQMKILNLENFDQSIREVKEQLELNDLSNKSKLIFVQGNNHNTPKSWKAIISKYRYHPNIRLKKSTNQNVVKPYIILELSNKNRIKIYDTIFNDIDTIIQNNVVSYSSTHKIQHPILWYFYADWCSHCIEFNKSKIWEQLQNAEDYQKIEFRKVESNDISDEQKQFFTIRGFPTIILQSNNGYDIFDQERNYKNLENFIKSA